MGSITETHIALAIIAMITVNGVKKSLMQKIEVNLALTGVGLRKCIVRGEL